MERYASHARPEVDHALSPERLKEVRTLGRGIARQVLSTALGDQIDVHENFRVAGFSFKTADQHAMTVASFATVPDDEVVPDVAGFSPLFRVKVAGGKKTPTVLCRWSSAGMLWRIQYPGANKSFKKPETAFQYLAEIVSQMIAGEKPADTVESQRRAIAGIKTALEKLIDRQGLPWEVHQSHELLLHVKTKGGGKRPAFASVYVKSEEPDPETGFIMLARASVDPVGPKIALRSKTAADGTPLYRAAVQGKAKKLSDEKRAYTLVAQAIVKLAAPVWKSVDNTEVWEDE